MMVGSTVSHLNAMQARGSNHLYNILFHKENDKQPLQPGSNTSKWYLKSSNSDQGPCNAKAVAAPYEYAQTTPKGHPATTMPCAHVDMSCCGMRAQSTLNIRCRKV